MAQIVAAGVTATMVVGSQMASAADPVVSSMFTLTFGDGTATYTSGGIPLTKGKLGCPATLQEFYILNSSNSDGYLYKFNHTAETIQIYQAPNQTHVHNFIMAGGVTTTADFLFHSSGAIGKAAATNVTIAGNTSASVAGGVVGATLAAAALAELATTAIVSATSLRVRVVGW